MKNNVCVSICCITYNQEKYIRKTLEGFINQKTNFEYEILIHDDCSTDNTAEIIKEFEEKYPKIVKPIYQKENQHSKGIKIFNTFLFPKATGKYIAMCEGDDYWIDNNKIQKQFEIMEKNENCSLCTHIVRYINETGEKLNLTFPDEKINDLITSDIVTAEDFFYNILKKTIIPFQTSSFFFRNKYISEYLKEDLFHKIKDVGDMPLLWYMLNKGNIFFLNEEMSCYRKNSIGSWSSKFINDVSYKISHYYDLINFFKNYDIYTDYRYHQHMEYMILERKFEIYIAKKKYKYIFKKEYRKILGDKCYPLKTLILFFLLAYFPFFKHIYFKIKGGKKIEK
ncbi:glycosyltransferase [Thomasclavelia cocleata]|uniref:glycosyltransferase n=1 Tax=Thomasclavelia cocleata TaxID=69824 RepID=UPI002557D277|nr:glycosyltransferase [Thomasclavelia cocleata]